jgi:hypothetical protein
VTASDLPPSAAPEVAASTDTPVICPRCAYPHLGLPPGSTCPECGFVGAEQFIVLFGREANRARDLYRQSTTAWGTTTWLLIVGAPRVALRF